VTIALGDERSDVYDEVELDEAHPRSIFTVFQLHDPPDEFPLVWLRREPVPALWGRPAGLAEYKTA
jgi:hypothetical protein